MYVRRKVFSAVDNCDYNYEDLYEMAFSEGYNCAIEEALFSDEDEDSSVAKGAALGALTAAGLGAGATFAGTGIDKLQQKKLNKLIEKAKAGDVEAENKLNEYKKYLGEDKGLVNKTKGGSNKLKGFIKENWKREAQEGEGKLANFAKGKGKVLGIGAGVLGAGAAAGAGINALKNKKNSEKAFSDDSEANVAKGAALGALTAAGVAGAGFGLGRGAQKLSEKEWEALEGKGFKEGSKKKIGKVAKWGAVKSHDAENWIKENWKREAQEGEGAVKNLFKGKGKVLGAGAGVLAAGAGVGAGINALKNKKRD